MDKQIKSYRDIAEYILDELRLAQTGELPKEVAEALGEYPFIQSIAPMGANFHGMLIELAWHTVSRQLVLRFLWHGGELLQEFRYQIAE